MQQMMMHISRLGWAILLVLLTGITWQLEAADSGSEEQERTGLQIAPRLGLAIEYGGFLLEDGDYTSRLRRRLEVDALQYGKHIIYLEFNEDTFFGTPKEKWEFNLMRYRLHLGGYRYDLGDYYLGVFLYHKCNNPFLTKNFDSYIGRNRENLYFASAEFLSKGMRLGMKNRGIKFDSQKPFEFLGRWNFETSVNKAVSKQYSDVNWLLRALVRYDILRYYRLIPYIEGGGEILVRSSWRFSPVVEWGVRYHIRNMDITPFFQWGKDQDFQVVRSQFARPVAQEFIYGGARMEFLLDADQLVPAPSERGLQFFPEVHGAAAYAIFAGSRFSKGYGNLEFDFYPLRWEPWTLFAYFDLRFDSRKEDFKPEQVFYRGQYGLTYDWQGYFIEGVVEQTRRLDANFYKDTTESSNLAGLRLGSRGIKLGHYNDGISFTGNRFQWVNNWNAQVSLGHYFSNHDWQYLWNLAAQIRWDVCRLYRMIPYLQGEANWRSGGGSTPDATEYAMESGLRFHGVLDLALYYRFQHREDILFFKGPSENQNLIGLKVLF